MTTRHTATARLSAMAITLLFTSLLLVLRAQPASACSCAFMDPEEALARGDVPAAFVGTLVDVTEAEGGEFQPEFEWTFEVEAVLIGDLTERTVLRGPKNDGANCGLQAEVGDRMGLLLYSDGTGWSASSCSTYDADALLAAGDPEPPTPAADTPSDPGSLEPAATAGEGGGLAVPLAVATVAGLAVLGWIVVAGRRSGPMSD